MRIPPAPAASWFWRRQKLRGHLGSCSSFHHPIQPCSLRFRSTATSMVATSTVETPRRRVPLDIVPKCCPMVPITSVSSSVTNLRIKAPPGEDAAMLGVASIKKFLADAGMLFKWRLSVWVALSALPSAFLPSSTPVSGASLAALAFGVFLCSGSANNFNQLLEASRDARMVRTMNRPLVLGTISSRQASILACISHTAGTSLLWFGANPTTALIASLSTAIYIGAYTPLKVRTPYNTHVGSIVGALPTLLGAACTHVSLLTWQPWTLFAVQLLWQFPHFYGLAWQYREDYMRGGFKAFPLTDATGHATARLMKPYLIATAALPLITSFVLGVTTPILVVHASVANCFLWYFFHQFETKPNVKTSQRFFAASLWHLLILLPLVVIHARRPPSSCSEPLHGSTAAAIVTLPLSDYVGDFCIHSQILRRLNPTNCIFKRISAESWSPTESSDPSHPTEQRLSPSPST